MGSELAIHGGTPVVPEGLKRRWPEITAADKAAVLGVLERGVLGGVHGPESLALEAEWAAFTGAKIALNFNSGTAALHAALFAAGVGPGDEVITSAFSFSATFQAILHQQAVPVFVDIDPRSYNIDPRQIEARITPRTRAILPVHIHGLPADLDEILAIAQRHNLVVIEDAAQAHGATYRGKMAGTIGALGAFSLNSSKNLAGGEGGFLITDDEALAERASLLRTFGERVDKEQEKYRPYTVYSIGWNYRTQEMPAALARSQLKRLNGYNANAQRNAAYLSRQLGDLPGLLPPLVPGDRTSIYHKYRLRFDLDELNLQVEPTLFRQRLLDALEAEGVAVTIWHREPLTSFPIFQPPSSDGAAGIWDWPGYAQRPTYNAADFPEAIRLLERSIVVNDETYPIYNQPLELMEAYVEAFRKVLTDPERILHETGQGTAI
jgi:perosamine synthetase